MIKLRSDNRVLTQTARYAFLTSNYSSGVSTINVISAAPYAADDFVCLGDMGQESSEIFRIGSVSTSGDITLQTAAGAGATTLYGHSESSKVYKIDYNQINFYWTAALGTIADETPTFSSSTSLSGWVSLTPASWYTTYNDTTHSTGFGWFVYRNSITTEASSNSNAIPYTGFSGNTVASVFSDFDSLMNVSELKLISIPEKFSWINEALSQVKNRLNLGNVSFLVSTEQTLSVLSGTAEYILPSDFSDIVSITDGQNTSTTSGNDVPYLSISKVPAYRGSTTHYFLRGRYLGIVPTPTAAASYYYRYKTKSTRVTGLSDYIILPDEGYYALKSFMAYRANLKMKNASMASVYLQDFTSSLNMFLQSAIKQDSNLDSWQVDPMANT